MKIVLNSEQIEQILKDLTSRIFSETPGEFDIAAIGIRGRGEVLAERFTKKLKTVICWLLVLSLTITVSCRVSNQDEKISVLESKALRITLTGNPYSFKIIEKSSGQTLLSHGKTSFKLDGKSYSAKSTDNITPTASTLEADLVLAGTKATGHVKFSLDSPEMVQVLLTCKDGKATNIKEEFIDQGEHYYGIWERPQGGHIDNRGADEDLIGFPGEPDDNARAPFYVTSGKYGIYVDTMAFGHYSIAKNGKTSFEFDQGQLTYYVIYGLSYGEILNSYNQLAGPAWMPPDWAFDSIWWRNNDYNDMGHYDLVAKRTIDSAQDNVEATANYLQYYQIPASAIWIDRPFTPGKWGWGDMEFDSSSKGFPDAQGMINYLNNKGYELLLWIANRCENALKKEGNANGYFFPDCNDRPAADMRNPDAYNWFKNHLDTFVTMGIKGYKIDRGHQGEHPIWVENENVYLFNKMAAESQMARYGSDYLIHARNCFDKSRKYVGIWNGDISADFEGLAYSIKNGLRCGAINFPYFGTDTGGYNDPPCKELFTRWFQFSTYCTMMEVEIDPDRTVWYDDDYPHNEEPNMIDIARKQCQDHHDLIPYTKSCMYYAHQTGMPVMRQLIFAYPNDSKLYDMWDEYLYGPEILVAPVVTQGVTKRNVYLPAGKWLDYNNKNTVYTGSDTMKAAAGIDVIPLYVRQGAIIPRGDILKSNNNWTEDWSAYLRIEFFPCDNTNNTFNYYTGDRVQPISCSMSGDGLVNIQFGNLGYDGTLEVYCRKFTTVTMNGTALSEGTGFTYDSGERLLTILFSGLATVEISGVTSIFDTD